jgi:signal transduction histidine kinase
MNNFFNQKIPEKNNPTDGISLSTLAKNESSKSIAKIVILITIVLIPVFIFFKLYQYTNELKQIHRGILSSTVYSISINDTYQIERTLHQLKDEFSLHFLQVYELSEANLVVKSWGGSNDNTSGLHPVGSSNVANLNNEVNLKMSEDWKCYIRDGAPRLKLARNYKVLSNRTIQIVTIINIPFLSFFIEFIVLFFIIVTGNLLLARVFLKLARNLVGPIEKLSALLNSSDADAFRDIPKIIEVQQLFLKLRKHENSVKGHILEQKEKEKNLAVVNLSKQVVHDIRSPLAALDMLIKQLSIPEADHKILDTVVGRIKGILNDLTEQTISKKDKVVNLARVIDEIVVEKKAEYIDRPLLRIDFDPSIYPFFLEIDEVGFKRCISNLINNSVEASVSGGNVIKVNSIFLDNCFEISISDQGKGVEDEGLKEILEKGISFNKVGGTGIGIKSSREFLNKYSATMEYLPNKPNGLIVKIKFPYLQNLIREGDIFVRREATIVVIDDELMAPKIWNEKLRDFSNNILFVKNFTECEKFCNDKFYLFLCDFDLGAGQLNGIEVKHKLIESNLLFDFILVTGGNPDYFKNELGLSLIPKSCLPHINLKKY